MSRKPESRIQLRIQKAIRTKWPKAYVRKIHGSEFSSGGMADLVVCIDGYFIALEVKVDPDDWGSDLQVADGKEVIRAGGLWAIVTSPEEAILEINNYLYSRKR